MHLLLQQAALLAGCGFMLLVAWKDFKFLRISNQDVLILLGIYAVYLSARQFNGWQDDLMAGMILFGLGFVFWLLKMMGAGDAKFYLPVGMFLGTTDLLSFALLLVFFSVLLWVAIKRPVPLFMQHTLLALRIDELRAGMKVPYGVPIALAACVVLIHRAVTAGQAG